MVTSSTPSTAFVAAYRRLLESGTFPARVAAAQDALTHCTLCAWRCGTNRREQVGTCRQKSAARVSSAFPHMGEENPLRGWRGSGTIFLAGCNMRCQFCQNHEISQDPASGDPVTPDELAQIMLMLQAQGCHNINFVSPSHAIAPIVEATYLAAQRGLTVPLVYNTGGYDSLDGLALLDGIIDIYMPDMKYADAALAQRFSKVRDYPAHNTAAVREMHRQVGDLQIDESGLAQRGLLVRHLVLPGNIAGTEAIVRFLAEEISSNTYINVMGQYRPAWRATDPALAPLNRPVSLHEIAAARRVAREAGLRLDQRPGWFSR